MKSFTFSKKDIIQMTETGHDQDQIKSHLHLFEEGAPFARLDRPCTAGDGIRTLSEEERQACLQANETCGGDKKRIKFVPASGAATRMFKKLIAALNSGQPSADTAFFFNHIQKFAFFEDLKTSLLSEGLTLEALLSKADHAPLLRHLLTRDHLNYAGLPKGLIKFHAYKDRSRTAFEEHLVEAAGYAASRDNACALHFTVPPNHRERFASLFNKLRAEYEARFKTRLSVDFSIQDPATDTIAVDMKNQPFRLADGRLLFRPGGHGALIHNLNNLDADIVLIKNIDNVVHEGFIKDIIEWKKILIGYFLTLQDQIFNFLNLLHCQPVTGALIDQTSKFLTDELGIAPPDNFPAADMGDQQQILIRLLDRPLRVCGMVENTGAPGGGPFWANIPGHGVTRQIVETAQIDMADDEQKSILNRLTHFNPVDLVCGVKNWKGEPFDLRRFVDHGAVFISSKSENGRDLKALELPGLWNGAMAFWNTLFVEVPAITFNPVKEVTDLLGTRHQPAPQKG